ncbi:MAG: hypothetical protein IPG61_04675 [bacterium]|nr:hypothetical protein [bacterium]
MRCARFLVLGLILAMTPLTAMGGLDYKTDSFGLYFDDTGNANCAPVGMFVPTNVYLLLMNPAGPTNGFECTLTPTGVPYFILSTNLGPNALDVDGSANGFAVGAASNYPQVGGAIVLATLQVMLQGDGALEFRISQATAPSMTGDLPIVTGDGVLRRGQVASCDVGVPVAVMNGNCPDVSGDCGETGGIPVDMSVAVTASATGAQDYAITAATTGAATNGYDAGIDIPKPTPPPGNYVSASFEHADWPLGPRFGRDYRASYDVIYSNDTWPLLVETDLDGEVTLTFAPNFNAASGIKLHLKDLQTGQYHNLFPDLTYVFSNDGLPNTYRFALLVGAAPAPPALSPASRAIPAGWSMIGLPLTPTADATVGSVILDPAPGYAYAYDYSRTSGYRNLAAGAEVVPGTGYWLASDTDFNWTMTGERDIDGVIVPLANGWNLVGNAIWFPGPFESLRVKQDGATYEWLTAAQMGLVSLDVQSFDPATGAYADALALQPWHGYWIHALQDGLSLEFYYGNFVEMPKRLTARKNVPDPGDGSWRADLSLRDSAGAERTITFGRQAGATSGFDAVYDRPLPPQSPAGGPRLMFHRPDWRLQGGSAISRDLAGLDEGTVSWPVVVTSPNPGAAMLTWDPSAWPAGTDFQLYLPSENRVVVMSMRKTTEYALMLGARAVQLIVRTPDLTSGVDRTDGATYAVRAAPNPFNPRTTIAFDLSKAGFAELRIYSVRGELVAVLGGRACEAGRHEEAWLGTDRLGRAVPSGSYFARLHVDGQPRGGVTKLSLVR